MCTKRFYYYITKAKLLETNESELKTQKENRNQERNSKETKKGIWIGDGEFLWGLDSALGGLLGPGSASALIMVRLVGPSDVFFFPKPNRPEPAGPRVLPVVGSGSWGLLILIACTYLAS